MSDPGSTAGSATQHVLDKYWRYVSRGFFFKYFPMVVAKARNARVWDLEGREYIDFLSSAAVFNVGHNNEEVLQAVKSQLDKFTHYVLYLYHEPVVELAELLVKITPGSFSKKVVFELSGGGACDTALKSALIYTRRPLIVSFNYSYHGTTALDIAVGGSFPREIRELMQ